MPDSVLAGTCIDSLPGLKETLLDLQPGVSSGFGGLRNEHLRCAAQHWEEREVSDFELFALEFLNGRLPPWLYKLAGSVTTVPMFKSVDRDPTLLRPLGIKGTLWRTLQQQVVRVNRGAFREHLEPHQIALTPGGGARLVHTVRLLLELRPDLVWIKMDIANAHNEVSRASIVKELEAAPNLQHLAQFAAICLASHHALVAGGKKWRDAGQGKAQGEPDASPFFCCAIHPFVKACCTHDCCFQTSLRNPFTDFFLIRFSYGCFYFNYP